MPARKSAKKKTSRGKSSPKSGGLTAMDYFMAPFRFIYWLTRKFPPWLRWPARLGLSGGIMAAVAAVFVSIAYFLLAMTYDLNFVEAMPARTEILDRNGKILRNSDGQEIGYLHGKNRRIVSYDEIPDHVTNAIIAQEDARFRSHGAIDVRSMGRVAFRAITRGKIEGGGTITMQLARNSFDLKKPGESKIRGIHRKILETFIAIRIESNYEKNEILEHYMNQVFLGGSVHGLEVAAQTYYNKSCREMTIAESALLAGILRAPNRLSPLRSPESALIQRDRVVDKMLEHGFISAEEAKAAKEEVIKFTTAMTRLREGSYALDAINRDLDRILEEEDIRVGGLIIETTLDPNIQELTEIAVEKQLSKIENKPNFRHPKRANWKGTGAPDYLQGAAVVIDNETGAVLAVVGGRSSRESQFNRAIQSKRPIGSLFKPFMFLAAFNNGVKPTDQISDARLRPGEIAGDDPNWSPHNSDGRYFRQIPVSRALIESRNTSSIRVASAAGLEEILGVAYQAGFNIDGIPRVPSSYLGSWGASPEIVASAYTIFPNQGTRLRPYYIQSIKNRKGEFLFKNGPIPYRAAEAGAAEEVCGILEQVNTRGTGRAIRSRYGFQKPSGGKTGTTNGPNDAWYAGFTSRLTCAVWVGFDYGKVITPGGSGASLALPIWADIMKGADRLPGFENGPITPGRAILVRPAVDDVPAPVEIPRAIPVEEDIPRAIPVDEIPRAEIVE